MYAGGVHSRSPNNAEHSTSMVVRVIQHEGVGWRSSIQHEAQASAVMQLQDPNQSTVLGVQYRNNHEITIFCDNSKRRRKRQEASSAKHPHAWYALTDHSVIST